MPPTDQLVVPLDTSTSTALAAPMFREELGVGKENVGAEDEWQREANLFFNRPTSSSNDYW